jgi:hypothetical protein
MFFSGSTPRAWGSDHDEGDVTMVAMIEVADLAAQATARSEALADRVFQATLATMDTALIHLGNRLGLYQALADIEPATSGEVAQATGLNERYVREWLE